MKRILSALCTLAVAAAFTGSPVLAHDEPTEGMPGKILIVKGGKLAKFISKPVTGDTFALPTLNDPTVDEGGDVTITATVDNAPQGDLVITLGAVTFAIGVLVSLVNFLWSGRNGEKGDIADVRRIPAQAPERRDRLRRETNPLRLADGARREHVCPA